MTVGSVCEVDLGDFFFAYPALGESAISAIRAFSSFRTSVAGIVPSRYQSDLVDRNSGPLRRAAHRRLRYALLQIAENLVQNNHHFGVRATAWLQRDKDPRWIRIKVAKSFSRLAYAMVAGRQLFGHACCQPRHYILDKFLGCHRELDTPMEQVMRDLDAATRQLPRAAYTDEAQSLRERLDELQRARSRGPQPLGNILPLVLAKLGVGAVQSEMSEDMGRS